MIEAKEKCQLRFPAGASDARGSDEVAARTSGGDQGADDMNFQMCWMCYLLAGVIGLPLVVYFVRHKLQRRSKLSTE